MLLSTASLWARPAYSKPVDVKQPDGTTVTLMMRGDEFLSFTTTIDGYTVIKGEDGFYRYAEKEGDGLKSTSVVARNPEARTAEEQAFLSGRQKNIHGKMSAEGEQWRAMAQHLYRANYEGLEGGVRRAITPGAISERIDYSQFKGLVILVNWNDRSFNINEPVNFYQKLTSQKNYTDNSHSVYPYDVKGSARDYFYANSMGMFDPTFDVKGPITIDYSCMYPTPKKADGTDDAGFTNRMVSILKAVLGKAGEAGVDFNDYDLNQDGVIDMVYIIFAGYGSYVSGNDRHLMWPHANDYGETRWGSQTWADYYGLTGYNGKKLGRYACSVEIQDYEAEASQHAYADGIGTICHEFSHVLGLADHYDTDYEQNGQAITAGQYDVMDNGADANQGLAPVGYNAFERYILGFSDNTVKTLDVAGSYELTPFNTGNTAYIIKSAKNGEVFYVENRQKQGWDEALPKGGLLVWRADTSTPTTWIRNKVNISPSTMLFELLGNAPISDIDLTATTNSVWAAKGAAIDLYDITQTGSNITFKAGKDLYESATEDFESSPVGVGGTGVAGKFCTWDLADAAIETVGSYGNGSRVAKINRNGTITSSKLDKGIRLAKLHVWNGGSSTIRFYFKVSTDGGTTWTNLSANGGTSEYASIARNRDSELTFRDIAPGSKIQLNMLGSSASAVCYVDDLVVSFSGKTTAIDAIRTADTTADGQRYNLAGQRVGEGYKGLVIKNGKKYVVK